MDWNFYFKFLLFYIFVTPCVGVWIEICMDSHFVDDISVTPCVGVWIEILSDWEIQCGQRCHSLRGSVDWNKKWGRFVFAVLFVTPCVGVWIEIAESKLLIARNIVTPCVGVWIEIQNIWWYGYCGIRHSLRGSVDWNSARIRCAAFASGHSLRGSVDWNRNKKSTRFFQGVTPCVGVWIEIMRG